jgi:parvulin-like peptidyl-prolyl isomerase
VSPDRGRGTSGGRGGSASGPEAVRRLGLLVFGVAFVVLFAIVAITEGVGDPSVPSGDIALVQGAPADVGEISQEQFEHSLELAAIQGGEKKAPEPGDPKYEELKESTLNAIFEAVWLQGEAAESGIEVSNEEVTKKLKELKKEAFKTEAEFQKFLKESGFTFGDVIERVKLQILSEALQEQLKEKAPTPSQGEVEDYYEAAKDSQFTTKPTRDVRVVTNKSRKEVEEAFAALSKDNSAKNWEKVAKKYSTDPNTNQKGGLQEGLPEGAIEEPLNAAIFAAPEGRIEGPVPNKFGYTIFEVENTTPESVQALAAVEKQIESTLTKELEQEYIASFSAGFAAEWTQRTFCASEYLTERCANYESSGHPSTAPEGCYEAEPKGARPEACPAPVAQATPALPGSITPLEPKGKPLAQRPRPMEEAGEGAAGTEALPEGVPPTGEAPPEEAPPEEAPSE